MDIEVKMPALSPTMEEGTLARWLVKEGDLVEPGAIIAEIETDKATMEFEAPDRGRIARILVPDGTDGVAVGTVIAVIGDEAVNLGGGEANAGQVAEVLVAMEASGGASVARPSEPAASPLPSAQPRHEPETRRVAVSGEILISPLAARIAEAQGVEIASVVGSGPKGRILKADLGSPPRATAMLPAALASAAASPILEQPIAEIPHEVVKLSSMRKTIARRLTESKQQIPHIYLTVDVRIDALLKLRAELNDSLSKRGMKLSVNDMIIKALALALIEAPACNVLFAGDRMVKFQRADISVAVSVPNGLITPVVQAADSKSLSRIGNEMKSLADRAREGKLQPHEFQGGTASLSNLGMFGIRQFQAVINPPQAMIMAVGSGEQRPVVTSGELGIATVISATGSFDHRAIDGADAATLMNVFRDLIEAPLALAV